MKPLRFGIVGCGGIGHVHFRCLAVLEREGLAKLVAGADVDPKRREARGKEWNVPIYASLGEMLEKADLDCVSIGTPSGQHAEHCIQVAKAGKHILCEKPLDLSLENADAAIVATEWPDFRALSVDDFKSMAQSVSTTRGRTPLRPLARAFARSTIIARVSASLSEAPTPQQCERTRFTCRLRTCSAEMRTDASLPNPVLMP